MTDRIVKTTLIIDEHGAVQSVHAVGDESGRTDHKLGQLDKSVKGLGKSFGGLKGIIGAGLGAVGVSGLAFGISDIASKTKELATETESFHNTTGIGATSSLRYVAALKARGISAEAGSKAFAKLAKSVQTAERQEHSYTVTQEKAATKGKVATSLLGVQAQAFQELGIGLGTFNRLSEQGKFDLVIKKFSELAPGAQKSRLELALFGKGGTALNNVLVKGNLGLEHQLELVKKYFPTIKGGAHALDELLERQAESKMAWEGLEFTLGQKLIPVMSSVMGYLSKVATEVEHGTGSWGELAKGIEGVWRFGEKALSTLKGLAKSLGISIGPGTLGAVLAGLAGVKGAKAVAHIVKKPVSLAKKLFGAGEAGAEGAGGAGALATGMAAAPWVLGAGATTAYGLDVYKSRKELAAHAKGALKMALGKHASLREIEGTAPGSYAEAQRLKEHMGYLGPTSLSGKPKGGGETPAEAALVSKLIASLRPTNDKAEIHLHLDSVKVAEAMLHNPRARRLIGEATAIYAQGMTARR